MIGIFKFCNKFVSTAVFVDINGWLACEELIYLIISMKLIEVIILDQGPLLLTWINFIPSMNK